MQVKKINTISELFINKFLILLLCHLNVFRLYVWSLCKKLRGYLWGSKMAHFSSDCPFKFIYFLSWVLFELSCSETSVDFLRDYYTQPYQIENAKKLGTIVLFYFSLGPNSHQRAVETEQSKRFTGRVVLALTFCCKYVVGHFYQKFYKTNCGTVEGGINGEDGIFLGKNQYSTAINEEWKVEKSVRNQ